MPSAPEDHAVSTHLVYEVQYQDTDSGPDGWYVMPGRNYNEPYRHLPAYHNGYATSSMDEAVEIAEALVSKLSFPHDPRGRHHRRITRSRVRTLVYVSQVTAVYEPR